MKSTKLNIKLIRLFFVILLTKIGFSQVEQDSTSLKFPFEYTDQGGLFLDSAVPQTYYYDPAIDMYVIEQKVGDIEVNPTFTLTPIEFESYKYHLSLVEYYKHKSKLLDQSYRDSKLGKESNSGLLPSIDVKSKAFETIFGGSKIELIPKGSARIDLAALLQNIQNPQIPADRRRTFTLDFDQQFQFSALGKVGENLQLQMNYDTKAGFAFENRTNIAWRPKLPTLNKSGLEDLNNLGGGEDNIVQNLEFGNISMPLSTSLIQGPQNLFGFKGEFKFGNTDITTVFSRQDSESQSIVAKNGEVFNDFDISAFDYEENQHYFLGQFFYEKYDQWLDNYPVLSSGITISQIEVWVSKPGLANNAQLENKRSIVGIRDLGNATTANNLPNNNSNNNLYQQIFNTPSIRSSSAYNSLVGAQYNGVTYSEGEEFYYGQMRKLNPDEYTFSKELGYISLNQKLQSGESLAVAFQYSKGGKTYKVGEFSTENTSSESNLILKLVKGSTLSTISPMWNLMMKNIYYLNGYAINPEDFILNVLFRNDATGSPINYIPDTNNANISNKTLLQLVNWDRLNRNGDLQSDGLFDFQEGLTINSQKGKVIFTKTKPFGNYLTQIGVSPEYIFNDLYDNVKNISLESSPQNKYSLKGQFKSGQGDGIFLGAFNVPRGSVTVTAGGQELSEGIDYTVDYQIGMVTILNEAIKNSGTPINVSFENNASFNIKRKRLLGLNVDHTFSDKFKVGATVMNYKERPLTQKANYGTEVVNNTMLGTNILYTTDAPVLTKLVNKLPMIETQAPSSISVRAEGAYLIPGLAKGTDLNGKPTSYIDDFEGTQINIDLKSPAQWVLAANPSGSTADDFNGEATGLANGYNRGQLSWYNIDPRFYGSSSVVNLDELSKSATRRVQTNELFPNQDVIAGTPNYVNTFDLTYYPEDKGPYNANPNSENPEDRWAGISRPLNITNFEQANVEYIEFWLLDPFADDTNNENQGGNLYFHLGDVSEDVLKDGNQQYENGLDESGGVEGTQPTEWGRVPSDYPLIYTFSTDLNERSNQDIGLDGLKNEEELAIYNNTTVNPVSENIDPANDDYIYYLDGRWNTNNGGGSLLNRYKYFRGLEGNSPDGEAANTINPDIEDINKDYTLNQQESYIESKIEITPNSLDVTTNPYIVDKREISVDLENNQSTIANWYQFRIPINQVGNVQLSSVRFMRMLVKGFNKETTLRFGSLDLIRSDWRRYANNLSSTAEQGEGTNIEDINEFSLGAVNIEENSQSSPPYILPPGVVREELINNSTTQQQNEQSMTLTARNLVNDNGYGAKGAFKIIQLDLRNYKNLEMFVSAQNLDNPTDNLVDDDVTLFIRFGNDATENYYEYELPLKYTSNTATSESEIWPTENQIDLPFKVWTDVKKLRDADTSALINERFENNLGDGKKVYVKGRPTLQRVKVMMIGLRNYSTVPKNITAWVNELRLSDTYNEGGWKTIAQAQAQIADLANVNVSGEMSTAGFGAIDAGPSQRNQEDYKSYQLNTTVNADKFLPKNWGVRLPVSYTISEESVDPKYNPFDTDILFDESENQEELKQVVRDYTKRTNVTISDFRKERTNSERPKRFYDIENFSTNFSYTQYFRRNYNLDHHRKKDLKIGLNYNFGFTPMKFKPFKDIISDTAKIKPHMKWVEDFNLNLLPSRVSANTDIIRNYDQQMYRDANQYISGSNTGFIGIQNQPTFATNFQFNYRYNLGFDLTKSLQLDFISNTNTLLDNIYLSPDSNLIWDDVFAVGRPTKYHQSIALKYNIPLNKFPYLDWINANASYKADYDWQAPYKLYQDEGLGNTIQNAQTINGQANLDFNSLYRRFESYKKLDSAVTAFKTRDFRPKKRKKKAGLKKQLEDKKNKDKNKNKAKLSANKEKKEKEKPIRLGFKHYMQMMAYSVKKAQFSFNQQRGTLLPGYLKEASFFGSAPNFGFWSGSQTDIRQEALLNGWITDSDLLTAPYQQTTNNTINATVLVEPTMDLRINLNANRNYVNSFQHFNYNLPDSKVEQETGNFNSTILTLGTAFKDHNQLFETFKQNRYEIANRLALQNGVGIQDNNNDGYPDGFGPESQSVIIPAFMATYQNQSGSKVKTGLFRDVPLPNWNISYTGLMNYKWFKKKFTNVELNHAYRSAYSVNNYNSFSGENATTTSINGTTYATDINNNLYPEINTNNVNIVEQFSPLIGATFNTKNDLQLSLAYNRDRTLGLSLTNGTLTEVLGKEYILGLGYILKDVKFNYRFKGRKNKLMGDMIFRVDASLRDNQTTIRRLLENSSQVTAGQNILSIKSMIDYNLTRNFNLQFFYDQQVTKYKVSTSFPVSSTRAGISAIFRFGN